MTTPASTQPLTRLCRPRPAETRSIRCILDVHEAAAGGDVRGYLDCFGEPLRSVLEQRVSDRSVDVVAGQLKAGNADLQSYATTERETPDPNTTRLVLERIYSDRVERLRAELRRVGDDWKIVSLVPIGRVAPCNASLTQTTKDSAAP